MRAMKRSLSDTDSRAARVQVDLLRNAPVAKRIHLACSLTRTAILLSRRAIGRANPDLVERDISLLFVELHYGKHLAQEMRDYLESRTDGP
jgi:hypothetical protein